MQRQDSAGSREFALAPFNPENGSAIEDDQGGDVFSRISQAIPDLQTLLVKYRETHGQLGVREELLRRAGVEQEQRLRAKDEEIYQLKVQLNALETKQIGETNRLRLEIGNLEDQVKELREQVVETERFKKEAGETRMALEAAKVSYDNLMMTAAEEKAKSQQEFEDWKKSTTTKHDAEVIALAIAFDKKLKEAEVLHDTLRQESAAAFIRDKEELRAEHQRQQREQDLNHDTVRKELETKLGTAQKDREEALIHERLSREVWDAERENLIKTHREEREGLQRAWEEQRQFMETEYKTKKDESDKAWIELHADAIRKAEDEKARVEKLSKELEELQKKFDLLRAESEKEKEVIKSVVGNLDAERARLGKLMECYGDVAEIKSKGDTY